MVFFGPRFGFDLSRVRIHTSHTAAESAQSVNALAYAFGAHIAFAAGQYRPGTEPGRRLLAHELAHVGQQNSVDPGSIRRMGDVHKVPAGLSCGIPDWDAPADEFVGGNKALRVDAFASEPGGDALNWKLSCLRASAVKNELMHPSAAKYPGLPDGAMSLFRQGETAEFGPEAQNRRATISSISPIVAVDNQPKPGVVPWAETNS